MILTLNNECGTDHCQLMCKGQLKKNEHMKIFDGTACAVVKELKFWKSGVIQGSKTLNGCSKDRIKLGEN